MTIETNTSFGGFSFYPQGVALRPDTAQTVQTQLNEYSDAFVQQVAAVMQGVTTLSTAPKPDRPEGDITMFCGAAEITGCSKSLLDTQAGTRFVADFSRIASAPVKGGHGIG